MAGSFRHKVFPKYAPTGSAAPGRAVSAEPDTAPTRPWHKRLGCLVPLGLVVVFLALGIIGSIIDPQRKTVRTTSTPIQTTEPKATTTVRPATTATTAAPKATTTVVAVPSYAGRQKGDQLADAGGGLFVSGYIAAANGWGEDARRATICAQVGVANPDASSLQYSADQWSMQTPNGQVVGSSLFDSTLGVGSLIKSGNAKGSICFRETEELKHGQFVFIFQPSPGSNRGIWLVDL